MTLKKGRTLEEDFEIEEDAVALDGVVVSANRNETTRRLAPTLVNVVDMKMFETTNSTTLAQGLSFQPGVRVESNCQNCGRQHDRTCRSNAWRRFGFVRFVCYCRNNQYYHQRTDSQFRNVVSYDHRYWRRRRFR